MDRCDVSHLIFNSAIPQMILPNIIFDAFRTGRWLCGLWTHQLDNHSSGNKAKMHYCQPYCLQNFFLVIMAVWHFAKRNSCFRSLQSIASCHLVRKQKMGVRGANSRNSLGDNLIWKITLRLIYDGGQTKWIFVKQFSMSAAASPLPCWCCLAIITINSRGNDGNREAFFHSLEFLSLCQRSAWIVAAGFLFGCVECHFPTKYVFLPIQDAQVTLPPSSYFLQTVLVVIFDLRQNLNRGGHYRNWGRTEEVRPN